MKQKAVIVTTEFRGVFFGYLKEDNSPNDLTLTNARNCIYWSQDVNGFVGLATTGPTNNCKIGPVAKEMKLFKITSIIPVSKEAENAWTK